MKPLPLGDSDSLEPGEPVTALAVQGVMSLQHATGTVTRHSSTERTPSPGNDHVYLLVDDLHFPSAVQSQPLAELGGPVFDETGHVIAVVGPPGDMSGAGTTARATADETPHRRPPAIGWWANRDIKFAGAQPTGASLDPRLASRTWVWNTSG